MVAGFLAAGFGGVLPNSSWAQLSAPEVAPQVDWLGLMPILCLVGGGLLMLTVYSLAASRLPDWFGAAYTAVAGLGTLVFSMLLWVRIGDEGATSTLAGAVGIDRFSVFVSAIIGAVVVLVALLAGGKVKYCTPLPPLAPTPVQPSSLHTALR